MASATEPTTLGSPVTPTDDAGTVGPKSNCYRHPLQSDCGGRRRIYRTRTIERTGFGGGGNAGPAACGITAGRGARSCGLPSRSEPENRGHVLCLPALLPQQRQRPGRHRQPLPQPTGPAYGEARLEGARRLRRAAGAPGPSFRLSETLSIPPFNDTRPLPAVRDNMRRY
ncbi:hypothetical protein LX36DRAFT_754513 [Colletotrichum falcatum]|nr:hypothetical protein LX36DRAFT_754513 [Colletotrichum falcatum]